MVLATSIRIRGLVQGVGFRPFVWHLATRFGIQGKVWNDTEGVVIHAWGDSTVLQEFEHRVVRQAPPLSRIDTVEVSLFESTISPVAFKIEKSHDKGCTSVALTADAATCCQCLADMQNTSDRHYGYAFTSCSDCGPRLSMVHAIPYDRANTSMDAFPMCSHCQTEYNDPADRRFHAQTNACPVCGPQLQLEDGAGNRLDTTSSGQTIAKTAALLKAGHIIAIKGIGGVHLAVDANHHTAVVRLRRRKCRGGKAFALMAADIQSITRFARANEAEVRLLSSAAAPIVLLDRNPSGEKLSGAIAPGQSRLGFMLPHSPLHRLLMQQLEHPIVLTSGNRSDEPLCIDNHAARSQLAGIADYFLLHERDIIHRLDDSVAMVIDNEARLLRRARGYVPAPVLLHDSFASTPAVLAMGGDLKNTFCQLQHGQAIISPHLGNLENSETHHEYRQALALYADRFAFAPDRIAVDLHPDYFSSQLGHHMAETSGLSLHAVQHHHAHIAAVLAEHRLPIDHSQVLGIALDGLGFGDDGTFWGGEFLLADYTSYQRLGCFQPVAMPGGAQAIREPWRNTLAHLHALGWEKVKSKFSETAIVHRLSAKPLPLLLRIIDNRLNAPLSSSCGRLFDAVAAALGLCQGHVGYAGQAAVELESLAQQQFTLQLTPYPYHFDMTEDAMVQINWQPMWWALLDEIKQGVDYASIAARFHRTVITAVRTLAIQLCQHNGLKTVVLGGGAFQNRLLLETLACDLRHHGYQVLIAQQSPLNDGGLALGQAAIAAALQSQTKSHA